MFHTLSTKMDISNEKEQHKAIHGFLDEFLHMIKEAQKNTSSFDAAKLKELMVSSKDALVSPFAVASPSYHDGFPTTRSSCALPTVARVSDTVCRPTGSSQAGR